MNDVLLRLGYGDGSPAFGEVEAVFRFALTVDAGQSLFLQYAERPTDLRRCFVALKKVT